MQTVLRNLSEMSNATEILNVQTNIKIPKLFTVVWNKRKFIDYLGHKAVPFQKGQNIFINRRGKGDRLHIVPGVQRAVGMRSAALKETVSRTVVPFTRIRLISSLFATRSTEINIVPYLVRSCSSKSISNPESRVHLEIRCRWWPFRGRSTTVWSNCIVEASALPLLYPTRPPCLEGGVLWTNIVPVHLSQHWLLYRTERRIPYVRGGKRMSSDRTKELFHTVLHVTWYTSFETQNLLSTMRLQTATMVLCRRVIRY